MTQRTEGLEKWPPRDDSVLKVILGIATMFGVLIQLLGQWRSLPQWAAFLLGAGMFLLGVSAAKIVLWDGLRLWIIGFLGRRRARRILQGQVHAIEDIVASLAKLVAPGYSFSLSMLAAQMTRQAGNSERVQPPLVAARLLQSWIPYFAQRWKFAWMGRDEGAGRGVLLELHSILDAMEEAAGALGALVPDSDGQADEVHSQPPPHVEVRRNWREIRLSYNRVVDTYRSVNSVCAPYLPGLSVFEHTHL
jgi:hypothetical protein